MYHGPVTTSYGALYIQGLQINLPGGQQGIGPFAIPASGVQDTVNVNVLSSGTTSLSVPTITTPQGVLIIPPSSTSATAGLKLKTTSGDSGIPLSCNYPTFYAFDDLGAPPTTLYFTATTAIQLIVQFI